MNIERTDIAQTIYSQYIVQPYAQDIIKQRNSQEVKGSIKKTQSSLGECLPQAMGRKWEAVFRLDKTKMFLTYISKILTNNAHSPEHTTLAKTYWGGSILLWGFFFFFTMERETGKTSQQDERKEMRDKNTC